MASRRQQPKQYPQAQSETIETNSNQTIVLCFLLFMRAFMCENVFFVVCFWFLRFLYIDCKLLLLGMLLLCFSVVGLCCVDVFFV